MAVKIINRLISLFAVSATAMIIACGGGSGGGGGSGNGGSSSSISGTAAKGAAIANKSVTLKDVNGTTRSAVTKSDGTFTIDTTGLTAPFLLRIEVATGVYLYSVSAETSPTTVNITPLTNFIVDTWYGVQGITSSSAFTSPATNPAPKPAALKPVLNVTQNMMQLWLDKSGVSTANLISTSFSANSSGLDQVLDRITSISGGTITISDGTTTQTSSVTLDTTSKSISIASTTTGGGSTSNSSITSVVPVSAAAQTALDEITARFNALATAVTSAGTGVTKDDITPYLSTSLIENGLNQEQFAISLANHFSNGITLICTVNQILSFDVANNIAKVSVDFSMTHEGETSIKNFEMTLKNESGSWNIYGNYRIADVKVKAEMRTYQGGSSGSGTEVLVNVMSPKSDITDSGSSSTVSQFSVQDPILWTTATTDNTSDPRGNDGYYFDFYNLSKSVADIRDVTAGSTINVTVTKTAGGTEVYYIPINSWTTESVSFTSVPLGTLAGAKGNSQLIQWTLPGSFPVARATLNIEAKANGVVNNIDYIISKTATSATITIPSTYGGYTVTEAGINLEFTGVDGQLTSAHYRLQ